MADNTNGTIYTYPLRTIEGEETTLEPWRGKVLLLVNTASECGFTPQYEGLESLWNSYRKRGVVVMGFPSNDFGAQEPGSNEEIQSFCQARFGVSFPLFEKGPVKGEDAQPLFDYLTREADPDHQGAIQWNFEKFLIGKGGTLIDRFSSRVKPESKRLIAAVEEALKE